MTPEDYSKNLLLREYAREAHKRVSALADGMITLSCPGPAPIWNADDDKSHLVKRPTGDPALICNFHLRGSLRHYSNAQRSNLPVGIQIIGQREQDYFATQLAKWTYENISSVSVT